MKKINNESFDKWLLEKHNTAFHQNGAHLHKIDGSDDYEENKWGDYFNPSGYISEYAFWWHAFNYVQHVLKKKINIKAGKYESETRCNLQSTIRKTIEDGETRQAIDAWNNAKTETPVLDENWYHLAVTYDQKSIRGYVDGVQEDENSLDLQPELNNGPVTIGCTGTGGAEPALGMIDEVGIFNDALTAAEVKDIMRNGLELSALAVGSSGKLASTWGNIKGF